MYGGICVSIKISVRSDGSEISSRLDGRGGLYRTKLNWILYLRRLHSMDIAIYVE